ncbi:hypothetical protein B7P43_G03800 [Cryptotermes secundus]|uniref:Uncharacterized protein n=1 Tax=Cryptotermes secundus TaxID=105785 RepID=A0A2J7Q4V2_9NEOP|nr:hypothetical protein B7P43_G03800 [Cryptotermes secundus]
MQFCIMFFITLQCSWLSVTTVFKKEGAVQDMRCIMNGPKLLQCVNKGTKIVSRSFG